MRTAAGRFTAGSQVDYETDALIQKAIRTEFDHRNLRCAWPPIDCLPIGALRGCRGVALVFAFHAVWCAVPLLTIAHWLDTILDSDRIDCGPAGWAGGRTRSPLRATCQATVSRRVLPSNGGANRMRLLRQRTDSPLSVVQTMYWNKGLLSPTRKTKVLSVKSAISNYSPCF